jgi:hypothetical protein
MSPDRSLSAMLEPVSIAAAALLTVLTGCAGSGSTQPHTRPPYASLERSGVMVLAAEDAGTAFDAAQSLALGETFRGALSRQRPGITFQGPATLAGYASNIDLQQTAVRLLQQQKPTDADVALLRESGAHTGYLLSAHIVEDRTSTRSHEATEEASVPDFTYYEEQKKVHTMGELDYLYVRYLQAERSGTVEVALYALDSREILWSGHFDVRKVNEARKVLSRMTPPPIGPRGLGGPARFYAAEQLIASTINSASPPPPPDPKDYPPVPTVDDLIAQAGIDAGKKLPKAAIW